MKILVDSLPYYREECPFENVCIGSDNEVYTNDYFYI